MRLHFSMAVMTIVGLHDLVKVSTSAEFKSFLLIMCIDAPESTTNSLSSGLRVDAGRHLLSESEKNAVLSFSFNFEIILANFRAASRAHRSCHSVSSRDRSSNFEALGLRWWGSPGQNIPSNGFWSRMLAWRTTAVVNRTHRIGFRMFELFRKSRWRLRQLHILKYATQLPCIWWVRENNGSLRSMMLLIHLQHGHCTSVTIFLDLLQGCSSTWRCAQEHFSPNLHPFSDL